MQRQADVERKLTIRIVSTNGKHLTRLALQLSGSTIVGCAVGEAYDESELLCMFAAVIEAPEPFWVDIAHDIGIVSFQEFVVERLMLLEEFMEACVGVELVEPLNEFVKVNVLPAVVFEFVTVANEFDLAFVNIKMNGHVRHPLIADAVLGANVFVVGHGGMPTVLGEPCLGVFGILSGQVIAELLESCRAREDAHQLDGLGNFQFDLCGCSQCQDEEQCGDDGFLLHVLYLSL